MCAQSVGCMSPHPSFIWDQSFPVCVMYFSPVMLR
jgi:hypothetical protein